MTYRNKKSGIVFTTSCVCNGEDWEEVKDEKKRESADAQPDDSSGENREEVKVSVSKAKKGKKQETAADNGGEDS